MVSRIKLRRWAKASPSRAWKTFWNPLANTSQLLGYFVSWATLFFVFQRASVQERDVQADAAVNAFWTFVCVALFWGVASIISAPFLVWREERQLGQWIRTRYVFYEPQLVAMSDWTWEDDGKTCEIVFPFAELNSYVDYTVELDPPVGKRASCSVDNQPNLLRRIAAQIKMIGPQGIVHGVHKASGIGSCRLTGRRAYLAVSLERGTIPVVSRVYIRAFDTNPSNQLIGG